MLGNSEDASDITQEAFLRLHRKIQGFRGDACFSTWLYRVTVNLCITELRRRNRSRLQFLDDLKHEESELHEEPGLAPDEALALDEDRALVQRVLRTLPADYRAIMVLRHYQQLAYEEIAEVLGLTLSQVKTRLFRARKMFKDRFETYSGDAHALQ